MTYLDDEELAEHLRRRAAGSATASELARGIEQATATARQVRARPWDRWAVDDRSGPATRMVWPAATLALGLAVVVGVAGLLRPTTGGPEPSSLSTSTWLLSLSQLEQVLDHVEAGGADVGKVVVATVSITQNITLFESLRPGGSPHLDSVCQADGAGNPTCPTDYVIAGSDPPIAVVGVPESVPCPTGRCSITGTPGPFALGLHTGHVVQYVSPVRLHEGGAVPWTVDEFIDSTSTEPMVVDGWLSGIPPLPCPLDPRQPNGFECGPAAWITSAPFGPSVTPAPQSSDGYRFDGPARGIRVENGAATTIGGSGDGASGAATNEPRHGLYLVNRLAVDPAQCFLCSSATAFVAAEVEPVDVAMPAPTATPATPHTSPATAGSWYLSADQLEGAVRATQGTGIGIGRVVVADVSFEKTGDCSTEPVTDQCYVIVSGSDPPIRLRDATAECPPGFFCALITFPIVPRDGPFALRILGDGSVSFVGYVERATRPPDDPSAAWGFDDLRSHLLAINGGQMGDYRLFVVNAWISAAGGSPYCLTVLLPDPQYQCGQAAWLTGVPAQPNAYPSGGWSLTPPANSIRLQNGIIPLSREAQLVTDGAQSQYGTFLVRAVLPPPATCFGCDGPVAELVAWLDPPRGLASPEP